ncbi:hypothetical protein PCAR4_290006 [Paraburkholderia caribensis]|nr:hypothetical protein PCAR4_290006 [Paraburkholderia caribensis]
MTGDHGRAWELRADVMGGLRSGDQITLRSLRFPHRVIEREQIVDIGVWCTLRQCAHHVQQPCMGFEVAGTLCKKQALDRCARLCIGLNLTARPR